MAGGAVPIKVPGKSCFPCPLHGKRETMSRKNSLTL